MKTTMKKLNCKKWAIIILCALFIAGFVSCSEDEPKSIQCSVLIDVTSSNTPSLKNVKSEDFLSVLDLEQNSRNQIEYRQAFITENFLNFTHQLKLKPAPSKLIGNDFDREEEIQHFKQELDSALSVISAETEGRKFSSVYVPFAREVNRMAQTTADINLIVLVSDLVENSEFLSFFKKNYENDLHTSPKVIEDYFQNELPLADDLTGFIIHIVHEPIGDDNTLFKKLSRVYQSMLEERGAVVLVQANLMK